VEKANKPGRKHSEETKRKHTMVRILESNIKQDAVEAVTTALQLNN